MAVVDPHRASTARSARKDGLTPESVGNSIDQLKLLLSKLESLQDSIRVAQLVDNVRRIEGASASIEQAALASLARTLIWEFDARELYFSDDLFSDPAWLMMLDLFAREADGIKTTVSSAAIAARVPATTALRWLNVLESRHLIERRRLDGDRRKSSVHLTPRARAGVERWLQTVLQRRSRTAPA